MRAEKTHLASFYSCLVLFLDLFGLLFLIVKVVFVPLLRLVNQKRSCCPTGAVTKSAASSQADQPFAIDENHIEVHSDVSDGIVLKSISETLM